MVNKTISQLPAATSLTAADLVPVVQGGVTKQATPDLLPVSTPAAAAIAAAQSYAVQRGNHTGTQTADTITDGTTNKAYTATEKTKLAGVATGATANRADSAVDTLLAAKADLVGGVIPSAQIPSIALTNAVTVATQAAMLALTTTQVQPGDVAVRTDGAGTFILTTADPTQLANWVRLNAPTDAVTSVNNQTGTVVLAKTDVGLGNVDNTSDTAKPVSAAQATAIGNRVGPIALTVPSAAPLSRVNILDQGAIADARTVVDAQITAGQATLTSATGNFTAADVGKTVVVNLAGATGPTTTTTSSLSTSSARTTLPVAALSAAIPAGTVVLTSGSNVQAFQTTGAAAGATSIPIVSTTPYYAFPSGSTLTVPIRPLKTTVTAVNSSTSVALAANAGATVTAGEAVLGTNNLTAIQSAISAASTFRVPLYIPAAAPGFDGYLYDGLLTVADNLTIDGDGAFEQHTTGGSGGLFADNMPSQAPWLTGSVLIQAAQDTDGIQFTKGFSVNPMRHFGIRFAGKFIATGHGFRWLPPITSSTFLDNGLMDSVLEGLKVFGHDGNHYAYDVMNTLYCTFINLHSFGGGGILIEQNSNTCSTGNAVFIHPLSVVCVGGSADAIRQANQALSNYLNYITWLRPQQWIYPVPQLVAAGYAAPTSAQQMVRTITQGSSTSPSGAGQVSNISWYSPDNETNAGSVADLSTPNGQGVVVHGGVGTNWNTGSELTTATQNTTGSMLFYQASYDLIPIPGGSAEVTIYTGGTSNPTTVIIHETLPAAAAMLGGTLSAGLSTGAGISTIPVNALPAAMPKFANFTIVSGANTQTFALSAAAAAGATSLSVYGQTPNFAYPSGSSFYVGTTRTLGCFLLPNQFIKSVSSNAKYATFGNTMGVVSAV